ncbi:unnamed protein product [Camellia sinensis]
MSTPSHPQMVIYFKGYLKKCHPHMRSTILLRHVSYRIEYHNAMMPHDALIGLGYYRDLPPIAKAYGVVCLMTSAAYHLQLYDLRIIALFYGKVLKNFQIWRLITNFFFLGPFSFTFAFRLLLIARHGVQLERGPFDKRTADFLWMFIFGALSLLVMAIVPLLWSPFMGASIVFMIVYVWSREFPNERLNIHGLFQLKGFYLSWYMLGIDLILGNPLKPDLLGMAAGHLYYFLTVLYPLSGGRFTFFNTPLWAAGSMGTEQALQHNHEQMLHQRSKQMLQLNGIKMMEEELSGGEAAVSMASSKWFLYYRDLPPVAKTYGVICLMTSAAYYWGLYDLRIIALFYGKVLKNFQYLEAYHKLLLPWAIFIYICISTSVNSKAWSPTRKGTLRQEDSRLSMDVHLWRPVTTGVMAIVPLLWSPFMGASIVFMIVYVWSREFPNERLNIHGLFQLKGFYLPWYMLGVDLILGNKLKPDLLGMAAGHLYYFLTVLYPLSGGRFTFFNTPLWSQTAGVAFQGRGRRLDGNRASSSTQPRANAASEEQTNVSAQRNQDDGGGAFRGRGRRLDGR